MSYPKKANEQSRESLRAFQRKLKSFSREANKQSEKS